MFHVIDPSTFLAEGALQNANCTAHENSSVIQSGSMGPLWHSRFGRARCHGTMRLDKRWAETALKSTLCNVWLQIKTAVLPGCCGKMLEVDQASSWEDYAVHKHCSV